MGRMIFFQLLQFISIACFAQKASYTFANGSLDDISGNGHNAIKIGNPAPDTDRFGNPECAYNFPGTEGDYLKIPFHSDFDIDSFGAFSVSLWYVRPIIYTLPYRFLFGKGSGPDSFPSDYQVGILDGNNPEVGAYYSLVYSYEPSYQANINGWTHLAVIYNNRTWKIFINGTQWGNDSGTNMRPSSINRSGNGLCVGKNFPGKIDDVNFYNYAITYNDVIALYNQNNSCETSILKKDVATRIIIYPNPVDDFFTVSCGELENEQVNYAITDIKGRLIKSGYLTESLASVNTSELARGMYLIKINGAKLNYVEKFIKK